MQTDGAARGLSASREDYLEAICHLEEANQVARVKDIADLMKVRLASVTGAMKALSEQGLINYAPYSYITLTPSGREKATELIRRRRVLSRFLTGILLLDSENAEDIAHRAEHAMDGSAIDKLARFLDFVDSCPRTGGKWLDAFARYSACEPREADCRACIASCIEAAEGGETRPS